MPRRSVRSDRSSVRCAGEQERDPAPGLRRVDESRPVQRPALSPAVSAGCRAAPPPRGGGWRPGRASGWHRRHSGRPPRGRSARPAGAARPSGCRAGRRDEHALGDQPGGARRGRRPCHGSRASRLGRVDHQHRWPVAAQEPPPGEVDRLAGPAALVEARRRDALQPLHGRQGLGQGRGRAGAPARVCRWRQRTRQGGGARVEPRGQDAAGSLMAPRPPPAAPRRAAGGRSARGAGRAPRWRHRRTGTRSRTW